MPAPPVVCDHDCHTKRVHLYMFYSTFLASLLLLALVHFVFFLSSRRRTKYEAKEYATRKLEFVSLGISDIIPPNEKEIPISGESSKVIEEVTNPQIEQNDSHFSTSPEPSTSPTSSSALNRMLSLNGAGSVPLQRIDEESAGNAREATPPNRYSSSSSCSASTVRDRTVTGAPHHEPVIVTVATVSALFQQHEIHESNEQERSRPHSTESTSSVIDISDLVNSPGRSITVRSEGVKEEPKRNKVTVPLVERGGGGGLLTKTQMLDVRMGGSRVGFLKSHRGEPRRKGDDLSTDAIFPASDSGGIYDT